MFGATFNLVARVGVPQFLDFFRIKQLFQSQKRLPNGVNTLSKIVNHFLSKSTKFCRVWTVRFSTSMWSKYLSNYGEILDFQCQQQQW